MTLKELKKLAQECLAVQKDLADETKHVPYVVAHDIHDKYFSALSPETVLKLISAIKVMRPAIESLANERWVEACGCCSRPAKGKANVVARETMEAVNRILEDL